MLKLYLTASFNSFLTTRVCSDSQRAGWPSPKGSRDVCFTPERRALKKGSWGGSSALWLKDPCLCVHWLSPSSSAG